MYRHQIDPILICISSFATICIHIRNESHPLKERIEHFLGSNLSALSQSSFQIIRLKLADARKELLYVFHSGEPLHSSILAQIVLNTALLQNVLRPHQETAFRCLAQIGY